jgi:hypothetical protein
MSALCSDWARSCTWFATYWGGKAMLRSRYEGFCRFVRSVYRADAAFISLLPRAPSPSIRTSSCASLRTGRSRGSPASWTLNLDPDSKNVLFVMKESVKKTIPYGKISSLEFYMANHLLRIQYRDSSGAPAYVDMDLPGGTQPNLLKEIQAETGIAVHLS